MAKKKGPQLPTGAKLAMINGVLRQLAMIDMFIGDHTIVTLKKDIPLSNAVGKVVHTAKAGETYMAMLNRYNWQLTVPHPTDNRMAWLPYVEMDECDAVPKTAAEQATAMVTYLDIENEAKGRINHLVKDPLPQGAIDIQASV